METDQYVPDYDGYWKEVITVLFEDCVRFFLPEVWEQMDIDHPPEFLEQELHKLISDKSKQGKIYNVVLAAKYQLKAQKDAQKRYSFKRKLVTLALEKEYGRPTIVALLRFVYLIISLPEALETQFEKEFVKNFKHNEPMELTKSQKRIAHTVYEAVYGQSLEERDMQQQVVEKTAIARRLLNFGVLNVEQVAEATGLSIANIRSIQQDLEKK